MVSNLELRKSLVEINAMRKLLPMCAWCRNVKDDNPETGDSQWMSLESFVDGHSRITHGICPSCSDDMIQSVDEDPNA